MQGVVDMMRLWAIVIVALASIPFSPRLAAQSVKEPPFALTDPARIEAGKARFNARCSAYCHGNEGSGGRTPAFKGRSSLKADEVFKVITEGRRSDDVMPSYVSMREEARWELVAYIMYLSRQKTGEDAGAEQTSTKSN
jgi:mono/diheme cytochrome c family protein